MKTYKLMIIGAGPAGISLAAEARLAGLKADEIIMVDKAETHSWVIRSLYPDKKLVTANYKGQSAVCHGVMCLMDSTKHEAISYLDQAIEQTGVKVNYEEEVLKIETLGDENDPLFAVETKKSVYHANIVVIAIGIFGRPNKPDYKLSRKLKGRVHFDITSFEATSPERILVVGGGDSASEFAQYLAEMGHDVTLSYRRESFGRMNSFNLETITKMGANKQVTLWMNSNIEALKITDDQKPLVVFKENQYGEQVFDRVIYALGGTTPENFLKVTGIQFDGDVPDLTSTGETTLHGLFVGGDLLAGKKGGSIAAAFNASRFTMEQICKGYLGCKNRA